jgi:hypothetical protein
MDSTFHVLPFAAGAEHLNSHGGCSPSAVVRSNVGTNPVQSALP